jgi:predicted metal-binding membrane protein
MDNSWPRDPPTERLARESPAGTGSRNFLGVCALLFLACAVVTVTWCSSMSGVSGMPMPGGWTMSMTWMLMPGQSWPGVAASFVGMWVVMMVAMMLPSLVPALWRYRQALSSVRISRLDLLTAWAGVGYFSVWTLLGVAAFPIGVAFAAAEMQHPALARAVPLTGSVVVLIAGLIQFTSWKARQLACCREVTVCPCTAPIDAASAFKHGVRLGVHCIYCCAGLTAILLAVDVMDIRAMAMLTAAITLERLLPSGLRVAHAIGVTTVGAGLSFLLYNLYALAT